MFPQRAAWPRRSSAASSRSPTRSRSSTRARGCGARPRYSADDFAEFREAVDGSRIASATIHAVYLINCASKEQEIRSKSIASLTHALRVGDGIGAHGVVLHAGARKGEPHGAVDEAGGAGDRGGARRLGELPDPAREHRRDPGARSAETSTSSPSWSSSSTATRGSASVSTPATCSPRGSRSARSRRSMRSSTSSTARSASTGSHACTQRFADPARRQPRPPRQPRRGRDRRARAGRLPVRAALRRSCRR